MNNSGAISVMNWVAIPIKYQTDTGLLLASMFLWKILGALILLGAFILLFALARFLLKPSAQQRSEEAKASVQLAGETA
jgi:uncharacterized membrane protein